MNINLTFLEFQHIRFKTIKKKGIKEHFDKESGIIFIKERTIKELEQINKEKDKTFVKILRDVIIFQNYIGKLKAGKFNIEILPKFLAPKDIKKIKYLDSEFFRKQKEKFTKNILYMLSWTPNLSFIDITDLKMEYIEGFYESIIRIFARSLLRLLKIKKNKNYLRQQDELKFIREKIDIPKFYRNPAKIHILPCIFHERTFNTLINKTLKYVTFLMLKLIENDENYRLLKKIQSHLFFVDFEKINLSKIRNIRFNRLNEEFKPFIKFCEMFLKNYTISFSGTKVETFSLLISMELLFEHFIGNFIKKYYKELLPISVKKKPKFQYIFGHLIHKETKKLFRLKPDISIEKGHNAIIDTKYKLLKKPKGDKYKNFDVKQSDLYQMYAYCKEFNAKKCILLYPENYEGPVDSVNWKLGKDKNIDLYIRTISLNFEFTSKNGISKFKNELREILQVLN